MRDKLFHTFIGVKDEMILQEYKSMRNKLTSNLCKARTEHYKNVFNVFASIAGDPQKI